MVWKLDGMTMTKTRRKRIFSHTTSEQAEKKILNNNLSLL